MNHGAHNKTDEQGRTFPSSSCSEIHQNPQGINAISAYLELCGEFDQLQNLDDDSRRLAEWNLFQKWSERRGNCYDSEFGDFTGEGGHEHYVKLHPGFYLKRTKWENSGLTYDVETKQILPATVSEYLFRLAWQDFFFRTQTFILGIAEEKPYRYAILTKQKEVAGSIPSEETMKKALSDEGFQFIVAPPHGPIGGGGALYSFGEIFYIADIRVDNCMVFPSVAFSPDAERKLLVAWDFFIAPFNEKCRQLMISMLQCHSPASSLHDPHQ